MIHSYLQAQALISGKNIIRFKFLSFYRLKRDPKKRTFNFVIFCLCKAYRKDGQIIAVAFLIKLKQFLKIINQQIYKQMYAEMLPLLTIPFSEEQKENTVYSDGFSVKKQYMKQRVGFKFLIDLNQYLVKHEIKYGIGYYYNPIMSAFAKIFESKLLYKGVMEQYLKLPYEIYQINFLNVYDKFNINPKL